MQAPSWSCRWLRNLLRVLVFSRLSQSNSLPTRSAHPTVLVTPPDPVPGVCKLQQIP